MGLGSSRHDPRRFGPRSFSRIAQDDHFLRLCRCLEGNALRAKLVRRAEAWRWGSLWQRQQEPRPEKWIPSDWPLDVFLDTEAKQDHRLETKK